MSVANVLAYYLLSRAVSSSDVKFFRGECKLSIFFLMIPRGWGKVDKLGRWTRYVKKLKRLMIPGGWGKVSKIGRKFGA